MFVRKLVEKASKKPGGNSDGLKGSDIDPRLLFHYGIPSGCNMLAYDPVQKILAVSSKDGRIKLFGKGNTQALLESVNAVPSKFLQFVENQGILVNVNSKNHIEIWDIEKNLLADVHAFEEDITSFTVMQHSLYMYVGDSAGNVRVLKLEQEHIVQMKYTIPYSASHGNPTEETGDTSVLHVLPQPAAESKRVLIIFRDGIISLWDIRESKTVFTAGGNALQSLHHEGKKVTSACWACPFGSKVAVGYSNGDIFIWSVSTRTELPSEPSTQSTPIFKLNVGYKLDKIPIASLRWVYADGKASRLYVMGGSDTISSNLLQVILLNEHTEGRTIKLGLQLPEPCIDMEIVSSLSEQSKHKQDCCLLLGNSGNLYAYDDCLIEKYLLQSQSKSSPSLPKEVMVKIPFIDSNITVAKFITDNTQMLSFADEDCLLLAKSIPSLFSFETKPKDGTQLNAARFTGFLKVKNLYITGHNDGALNFWDLSCPLLVPILSLKQQSEDDLSLSGIPVTALFFNANSRLLVSGDQSGMVRIFRLKPEPYANVSSFLSLQGSTKKGNDHIIQSVKLLKVNGSVLSVNINHSTGHLAVGSSQGYVSVLDIEGPTVLYQKHIASEISTGIISLHFQTCSFHGFDKNVLAVATEDSSVLALDSDNGNTLSTSLVHPKKPTRALFMQILDGQDVKRLNLLNGLDLSKGSPAEDGVPKQSLLLLCSEKAAYVYSFTHVMQGVKKVIYKKKFQASCCWASTFYTSSDVGLILLFTSGKVEIRSLPELSLIKETSIRGFTYSTPKPNSFSDSSICSSCEGELVMVNGDQEIFFFSLSLHNKSFRLLDSFNLTYQKDLIIPQEDFIPGRTIQKEKKKGIFSYVIKDIVGSKAKNVPEIETEDTKESFEELSTIFSTANFTVDAENTDEQARDEDELDLDDIDIDMDMDIPGEKPKEQNMLTALNKEKLASKFMAFKGKVLKQMKSKTEKNSTKEEQQDEKVGQVDQIKRRYGFSSSEANIAKMAESKLQENMKKLQGINLRTTEMQDTAKSFSSLANEVLRTEQDRRGS
ncbi:hypothetical protein PRUPE_7G183000 [Prunus persica]|uniref:Lethal giant larvae (Lgl)-like C-terminal domain-containing protein n=1 Tax=Prunus persica TaxID=3760 RepID=A0A251NDD1_PRUPE|nr:uncharacterized protein LOC18769669 [Prunus persica]ONH97306.1 hypothetical protein PRUPE_7G183000 [Prunus persica]